MANSPARKICVAVSQLRLGSCQANRMFAIDAHLIRTSTRSYSTPSTIEDTDGTTEVRPKSQTQKDPLGVLKALASTIRKIPGSPAYGFSEDHAIYPRSQLRKKEFKAAMESGNAAAEFVIAKHPHIFPFRQADPDWQAINKLSEDATEMEQLEYYLQQSDLEAAIKTYESLIGSGETLPLLVQNRFLDLVTFNGVGNQEVVEKTSSEDQEEENDNCSSDSDSSSSSEDEEEKPAKNQRRKKPSMAVIETLPQTGPTMIWSTDNYAEKVFASMTERDEGTYEVFILGLMQYKEHQRAFSMLDEMLSKGFQGSTFLYNSLISSIGDYVSSSHWDVAMDLINKMKIAPEAVANLDTYNTLLELCFHLRDSGLERGQQIVRDMISNGIEPCLGTYNMLVRLQSKSEKHHGMVREIVSRISSMENKEFVLQHTEDVLFFNQMMALARASNDWDLADKLLDIALTGENIKLIGSKASAFYGNYFCALASGSNDVKHVFDQYNKFVPTQFIPREWVYVELFRFIERTSNPEHIISLYQDMKSCRVRLSPPICNRVFSALSVNLPKPQINEYLEIALDVYKWMRIFSINATGFHIGQLVRLLSLNGDLEEAWKYFEEFQKQNLSTNFTATSALLQAALAAENKEMSLKALDTMVSLGQSLRNERLNQTMERLKLNDGDRLHYRKSLSA